ncbi:hypothetical protein BT96DRAFT_945945 [Gymnopus androsaceus JB14]|uniref:Uncharacterized protein n=1 Tax=Gymnopus androsaceus JB14 TaxID=1447944 RepID=A0A6A4GZV7_9AGAR|nr:hypothetical protein BT96DRAFT_945945 [Gymnopus androsaceus JB14]
MGVQSFLVKADKTVCSIPKLNCNFKTSAFPVPDCQKLTPMLDQHITDRAINHLQGLKDAQTKKKEFTRTKIVLRNTKYPGVTAKSLEEEIATLKTQIQVLQNNSTAMVVDLEGSVPLLGNNAVDGVLDGAELNSAGPIQPGSGCIDPALTLIDHGRGGAQNPLKEPEPMEQDPSGPTLLVISATGENTVELTQAIATIEQASPFIKTGTSTIEETALMKATESLANAGLDICQSLTIDSTAIEWPVDSNVHKLVQTHAIALWEWVVKFLEIKDNISSTAQKAGVDDSSAQVYAPVGFLQPGAIIAASKVNFGKLSIFDEGAQGLAVAMAVFKNQSNHRKCLTHSDTNWRGKLKLIGARLGHLDCGCPNILALVELFIKKFTAQSPLYCAEVELLKREMSKVYSGYKEDTSFSAANLLTVQHALTAVSGLSAEAMLQPAKERYMVTSEWAVKELIGLVNEEHREGMPKIAADLRAILSTYETE